MFLSDKCFFTLTLCQGLPQVLTTDLGTKLKNEVYDELMQTYHCLNITDTQLAVYVPPEQLSLDEFSERL